MRTLVTLLALLSSLATPADPLTPKSEQSPAVAAIERWEGIPLPPGAKLYRKAGLSMIASVVMPFADVERWYQSTMTSDGWKSKIANRSEKGWLGSAFVALEFRKDKNEVSVLLTDAPKEGYVMLQLTNVDDAH